MTESEVARFRQVQGLQEEAAQRALYSPASVAHHQSVQARMQQGADRIVRLFEQGKIQEAIDLFMSPSWALGEESTMSHYDAE